MKPLVRLPMLDCLRSKLGCLDYFNTPLLILFARRGFTSPQSACSRHWGHPESKRSSQTTTSTMLRRTRILPKRILVPRLACAIPRPSTFRLPEVAQRRFKRYETVNFTQICLKWRCRGAERLLTKKVRRLPWNFKDNRH